MILGAGLGSRMGHLTADVPKPLLELGGKPLLGHLLDRVHQAGVAEIYVNLHYKADLMRRYLAARPTPVPVHTAVEARLSGPAGALRVFGNELQQYDAVLVASGDVIVGESLRHLVASHRRQPSRLTFAVTQVREARRYGVLDIAPDGTVRGAREKPDVPDDVLYWISAGVYCLDPRTINDIPGDRLYDFARDLAPALASAGQPVRAHRLTGYWRDVGTPEALASARQDAAHGRIPWFAQPVPEWRVP
ncbi:NDP-sugar synthase [Streptomyces sp. NPDC102384]|uniref:nucleotidyltransferase family protein n=1 Tax=Streptomyces sp. NPDC102384 TaxID=3366166 RepID=UPI0038144B7C